MLAPVYQLLLQFQAITNATSGGYQQFTTTAGYNTTSQVEEFLESSMPSENEELYNENAPSTKEILSVQRALEWLKDKRFSDFGWGNDTHLVILAKEVS